MISGSSPLTRGTHRSSQLRAGGVRFIPAHAGNTDRQYSRWCPGPVHPRSRGEHDDAHHPGEWARGSSPLTRGTLAQVLGCVWRPRFIPAHAGNTLTSKSLHMLELSIPQNPTDLVFSFPSFSKSVSMLLNRVSMCLQVKKRRASSHQRWLGSFDLSRWYQSQIRSHCLKTRR